MRSEILFKLDALEQKIQQLLTENFDLTQKNANFEEILKENAELTNKLQIEIERLDVENKQLRLGKAFVGGKEGNEEAKRKIDSLIKEINLCITTLNE